MSPQNKSGNETFRRYAVRVLQVLGAALLLWLIVRALLEHRGAAGFWQYLRAGAFRPAWGWLWVAAALMPLNWYCEVRKWQNFFSGAAVPGLWAGFNTVMGGVALSFLTPNRSGEYAARVLVSTPGDRWPAVYAALGSAYCQLLILLAMGLPALALFSMHLRGGEETGKLPLLLPGIAVFCGLIAAGVYLRPLLSFAGSIGCARLLGRWWPKILPLGQFTRRQMLAGLLLAALRYAIYTLQYYAMLRFSGIHLAPLAAFTGVGSVYLIQTGVPLPPLLGFLARGEIALLVWQTWDAEPLRILAATYGLFIINLGIPAFLFILGKSIPRVIGFLKT